MSEKKQKIGSRFSVRVKLLVYFAVFTAIAILVMWFFQVYLLNTFYEVIRRREMYHTADELIDRIDDKNFESYALAQAQSGVMAIGVYRINDGQQVQIVNVDAMGKAAAALSSEQLREYYDTTTMNKGGYTGRFTSNGLEIPSERIPFFRFNIASTNKDSGSSNLRLVHLRLAQGANGEEHLIVLNAALRPLHSTVMIMRAQFSIVFAILLILAGVLVWMLYVDISVPLMNINNAAKKLALGKYDVEFKGAGYREANEIAETLNYASHELSRLDNLQKELIANISHDLRTPLTMIKGYSEVMRDIPGENTAENIQVVIDETTRLSELVSDLLDLSKIQSGARKAVFEEFDLTAATHEVLRRYDAFTAHQGYHITFAAEENAMVFADHGMILQVLYNLINNAINYTGADLSVAVKQTVCDGRVRISVTDTGLGIEPDQISQIWDRYYRVDKVHRRAVIGTGLGLSIVKGVLELHNASYGVINEEVGGATFWFELDLSTSITSEEAKTDQTEE